MRLFLLSIILLLSACGSGPARTQAAGEADQLHYARGFRVERTDEYTLVSVRNPWDTLKTLRRYVLVPADSPLPGELPEGTLVRTPLQRVVPFSSVHCGVIDCLGAAGTVVGICESRYVNIPVFQEALAEGRIVDVGEAASPNVERIMDLSPEVLITTPLEGIGYGRIEKMGIPLIEATDYMELTPLGRAEWIRFYGLFFGCEQLADSLFAETAAAYNELSKLASGSTPRPRVLSESKRGSAWHIPGSRSYAANLYRDAGADYPWADLDRAGSVPMSFEQVLERAGEAEVWVLKYNRPEDMTYADLEAEGAGNTRFAAFRNRNVYACNTNTTPYYEDLPIHPERILRDLVWVFHPELLPGCEPRYFHKMKE